MRLWSVLWCGAWLSRFFAGIIFNTRAVVGSLCVGCGEVSAFVVGLLFSTRVVGGVRVLWGGAWLSRFFAGIIFNTRAVV